MDLALAGSSFALLLLAEMGDKTQLMTMTLAARYRPLPVAIGVCAAFLVLDLAAVLVGEMLFLYVPEAAVLLVAALLFLWFGWSSWRAADAHESGAAVATGSRGALLTSFLLILVAELGDKTQLTLLTLAASTGATWSVFAGGTLALWAVSLLGVFVGAALLARVPARLVHRGAGLLFGVSGLLAFWKAVA
jgi:putative Ca2+/H+ antiporter (TMEM165/GDT1 family)